MNQNMSEDWEWFPDIPRDGQEWWLESPVIIHGLEHGEYVLDVEVEHDIGSPLADRPKVVAISRLARLDGSPLGSRTITVDLRSIAVDAIVKSASTVMIRAEDGSYRASTGGEAWRDAARQVRAAAAEFGRFRWTPAIDDWLVQAWRHILDHGCGSATDLADLLGSTPHRIALRLSELRKRHGTDVVPLGRPGRPRKDT